MQDVMQLLFFFSEGFRNPSPAFFLLRELEALKAEGLTLTNVSSGPTTDIFQ